MATLTISGLEVLVDDADLEVLATRKWWVQDKGGGRRYVVSKGGVPMHRFVMKAQRGQIVDHKNRNTLDNRRSNLRFCTHAQNQQNRHFNRGNSLFKGVWREGNRWRAYIGFEGKQIWLGSFDTEEQAALAHDRAARIYHGEFAYLNFPSNQSQAS